MDRKEFLNAIGRISVLSFILVLIGWFVARDKLTVASNCSVSKHCRSCVKLTNCSLPEAVKIKADEQG